MSDVHREYIIHMHIERRIGYDLIMLSLSLFSTDAAAMDDPHPITFGNHETALVFISTIYIDARSLCL